ncbi:PREDICTED: flocculation protein FLO11 [Rhagoletis zephyria]|uniref:flocculation protein FLO11 n=1 Tax=Rhagoletis zephyria TaxID=28612 RepID=UPI0008115F52|nr:PREDICTED: flocculation protein FLO11 [Rhagoletis zephyria]XP_017484062.1 PREDICTED: flocculation protein FLO11 [Rhagoletis zephyria]
MDLGESNQAVDGPPQTITAGPVTSSNAETIGIASSSVNFGESTVGITAPLNNKTLKRCLSVPILRAGPSSTSMTTRSAAAALAMRNGGHAANPKETLATPKKSQTFTMRDTIGDVSSGNNFSHNMHIGIPRSNPSSREVSPAPMFNIFAPRARRYSASYTPHGAAGAAGSAAAASGLPLCLTPRVSQLRQEECVDMVNSREANHEREIHSAMQMSQSWEDLTLVAENWSCKSEELSNPLQVTLPSATASCSSPSPTSNRAGMKLPYGLSPSPTRRTFATRRSMSPIAMRPSQLGPVKRKFELDDSGPGSNWNVYSQPPLKKIFTESRGTSPVCQSPSSICPSPDSGTYDGRITPKLFISKLCTNNTNNNSACSSPSSSVSGGIIDSTTTLGICSSASSTTSSVSGGSEPMCIGGGSIDEGISIADNDDKLTNNTVSTTSSASVGNGDTSGGNGLQPMSTDIQDDATLLDDMKSETSSIGGCSSISIESSSCDSASKAAASFLNRLNVDDISTSPLAVQKSFYINKQGLTGHKKFIVSSGVGEQNDSINVNNSSASSPALIVNTADVASTSCTSGS